MKTTLLYKKGEWGVFFAGDANICSYFFGMADIPDISWYG